MAAFGGQSPNFPIFTGGGELWTPPDPPPSLKWWQFLIQLLTFDLIRF